MMGFAAAAVAVLLLASAVLTAAHDAAMQIASSHIRTLIEEGFEGAEALAQVRDRRDSVQISIRVVSQTMDLVALAVIAVTGVSTWGAGSPLVSTALGVVVVLVVGDLAPHLIAARSPVRLALSFAPMLLAVDRFARPLTAPVEKLGDRIGSDGSSATDEQRELREIQEIGQAEGVLVEGENRLVERAFRLDELTAWDVMVPRVDIFAWKEELTLDEVREELAEVPYSRVPVYRDSIDDVTGIVYVREAYERIARGERDSRLADFAREPFFVPGSLSLAQLLGDFQTRRIHLGIVADEFGGTDGLVTLEDVLEELVGEIHDETDVEEIELVHVDDRIIECDAGIDLRDLGEALDVTFPQGEHRSLNGFLLEELGHVPEVGERIEVTGVGIEVLEASDTQVLRARLERMHEAEAIDDA